MKVAISTMSPYSYSLIKSLETQNIFAKSLNPWGNRDGIVEKMRQSEYNILHIQWPEALLTGEERNNLSAGVIDKIEEDLISIKSRARIIFTFHNKIPHENIKPAEEKKLYEVIIRNTDLIIHHSEMGKKIVNSFYEIETAKKQVVLRHPPYYYYKENNLDKNTVRGRLNIPKEALCIGIIGNISPYKQIDVFLDYLMKSKANNFYLLLAGQVNELNYGKVIHKKLELLKDKGIKAIVKNGWLTNAEVAFYAAASDSLFCGNRNSKITSGIPHLAEMAGKAIFGYENNYLKEVAGKYSLFISEDVGNYCQDQLLEQFNTLGNAAAEVGEQWNPDFFGKLLLKIYQDHKNT